MVERVRKVAAAKVAVMLAGLAAGALAGAVPAHAQFFWDQPRYSPDDVARIVMQHGFRPMARPVRNDDVYVADVQDQRGRRERLIVSADSGEIMQRFYLEGGRHSRRYAEPSPSRGPIPPGMIPDGGDDNLVTRLSPDDGDFDRPPPPAYRTDIDPDPRPRRPRRPRVVEQETDRFRDPPVESAPLAPPPAAPEALRPQKPAAPPTVRAALPPKPAVEQPMPTPMAVPAPAVHAIPAPAASAPAATQAVPAPVAETKPSRPISHDPLAIPGSRAEDKAQEKASAAARPVAQQAVPPKTAVPVVPLE